MQSILGNRFSRWVVIGEDGSRNKQNKIQLLCICDCGTIRYITRNALVSNTSKSCGCLRIERIRETKSKNKLGRPSTYKVWCDMKQRCYNTNNKAYKNYGGRGINVCDRWLASFNNFYLDMGERAKGLQLDRINNNGNYEPSNCRWVTSKENNNNKTRS